MYVDWEYYKIFYYVAKYQNFTKAARVLGNNQPNITHSMNRLESQLNCVLFTRSNRGVTLTPEGEMLYSRIASAAGDRETHTRPLMKNETDNNVYRVKCPERTVTIMNKVVLMGRLTKNPEIKYAGKDNDMAVAR